MICVSRKVSTGCESIAICSCYKFRRPRAPHTIGRFPTKRSVKYLLHIYHSTTWNSPAALSNGATSSSPISTALTQSRALLFPVDLGLETYNSQYLQRHSTLAQAYLACAEVSHKLKAPLAEVENTIFGILPAEVSASVSVRPVASETIHTMHSTTQLIYF